ncbi:CGNR zinc finger domain-containing protein [Streptomyces althioticus]|uniref:CGNR zinc finger domain-containing protein n=1 Tax=Streptomyces althioticus TaxID=83380 RepID=UPI0036AF2CF5
MGAAPQAPRTRVTARARDLRFDAGSLSLNLVATVGRRPVGPVERMGDAERLAAWCHGVGLTPAPGYDAKALLRSLHALRDAAYDIASSLLDGHRPSPASVDLVNGLAACEPPAARLELTSTGVRPAPGSDLLTEDALLSAVSRDLIELVSDASRRERLTTCASEVCRMLYLDPPSGRTRQWCSMRRCGNNAKAAAHRRRRAATAEG